MWIKAPSLVSSVTRKSSSKVPSPFAVTQSPPPASTLPRRRSPSNEPPVTGKMESAPRGVEPISVVAGERGERPGGWGADLRGGRRVEPQEHERSRIHEFVPSSENFVNGVDRT